MLAGASSVMGLMRFGAHSTRKGHSMVGAGLFSFVSQTAGCVALAIFAVLLVVASVIDMRERRIPNALSIAAACVWAASRLALGFAGGSVAYAIDGLLAPWNLTAADGVMGALALGGGVLVLSLAFEALSGRASMGGGDIKLLAVAGLFLGWERGLMCLFVACAVAVVAMTLRRVLGKSSDGTFPFAPFILVGAVVAAAI